MTSPRALRLVSVIGLLLVASFASAAQDFNQAGTDAYGRGDFVTAERLFREAIRRTPREPVVHYHLGVTLAKLARWREAAAAFDTAIRLRPSPEIEAAAREGLRALEPVLSTRKREDADEVRLTRVGGVWVANVIVNGHQARFLVDTGASICVISPRLAEVAGVRPDPDARSVPLVTLGGPTSGPLVRVPSISVGAVEARDVHAVVHTTGDAFDGILGNTFLARYHASLDPRRGVLNLEAR